jgi:hypothetical protein
LSPHHQNRLCFSAGTRLTHGKSITHNIDLPFAAGSQFNQTAVLSPGSVKVETAAGALQSTTSSTRNGPGAVISPRDRRERRAGRRAIVIPLRGNVPIFSETFRGTVI